MKNYITLIILFYCNLSFCQNTYTISGFVRDSVTGEELIGATIPSNVATNLSKGAVGFFAVCDVYSKQATFKTLLQKN